MINLLITLIILMAVGGLLYWLVSMLPIPEPFGMIIKVCAVLICILLVLGILFGGISVPHLNIR